MAADLTQLLNAHATGDEAAFEGLVPLVYEDLRRLARAQLRRIRFGETLNTTALVHEAYLRLVDQPSMGQDRHHFYSLCARVMRQIIVDSARRRRSQKRGGFEPITQIDDDKHPGLSLSEAERVLEIDDALGKLLEIDERLVRVVECKFFMGFTGAETALALDIPSRTVDRLWVRARAWLRQSLESDLL
ncbi:MAG: sigma-70 family RNA polymerase sigma factor [Deltaproteobacteria bacterium]|nr:sigma-70 family RNA polymerase sigma factor [Deltaproteobacteria bacterium]